DRVLVDEECESEEAEDVDAEVGHGEWPLRHAAGDVGNVVPPCATWVVTTYVDGTPKLFFECVPDQLDGLLLGLRVCEQTVEKGGDLVEELRRAWLCWCEQEVAVGGGPRRQSFGPGLVCLAHHREDPLVDLGLLR